MRYLFQIWDAVRDNPPALISLISAMAAVASAVVAVIAALLNSVVSVFVARRQIRATLVSGNRQAWINALRDDLAELFEVMEWLHLLRPGTYGGADGYKFVDEKRIRERFLKYRIQLRLNPLEADHIELLRRIDTVSDPPEEFYTKMANVMKCSQAILKREWVRVKRGR